MFPKVKNVNVESLTKGSKMLFFPYRGGGGEDGEPPQAQRKPRPKPPKTQKKEHFSEKHGEEEAT